MKPNIPWRISGCGSRHSGGIFDYDTRKERLEEVLLRLEDPAVWSDPTQAQKLGQERARLEETVQTLDDLDIRTHDAIELLELVRAEDDAEALMEIEREALQLGKRLGKLEFLRMFAGELDIASAFVDIQAGSGGTEAQDWAEMLLRMYLRWAEDEDLVTELVEKSEGEVAGIKSATVHLRG
ncbi:MAG: PCRF domain-containing protein, partial [Arenicellales bacterium]|nr:PCRF domain-containing protein [Arenicellales bacterium]